MSDWIEKDGKRYFESGYLAMANNTAKRRGDRIRSLEAALQQSTDWLHDYAHSLGADLPHGVRKQIKANRGLLGTTATDHMRDDASTDEALEAINRIEFRSPASVTGKPDFDTVRQALERQRDRTPAESDYEAMNQAWLSAPRTEDHDRYIVGFAEGIQAGRRQRVPEPSVPPETRIPWHDLLLSEWSIVGMNHYHVNGERFLFVALCKDGCCIKEEGRDDKYLWNRLWHKANASPAAPEPDDS